MDIPVIINASGLVLDIAGALLMVIFTPKVNFRTYLYNKSEGPKIEALARRKNRFIRLGATLLFFGFSLQLAALFLK